MSTLERHEWLNRNCQRSYPLREDADLVATNTSWSLPRNILADLTVSGFDLDGGCYLSGVTITPRILSLTIARCRTGESIACASVILGVDQPLAAVPLVPLIEGVAGSVVFGTALNSDQIESLVLHQGSHRFSMGATFEARCQLSLGMPAIRSIRAQFYEPLRGDVRLEAGTNLDFSIGSGEDGGDPVTLITLALKNPGAFLSPCEAKTTPCDCSFPTIQTINDVGPDPAGNLTISIQDENGSIQPFPLDALLSFLVTRTGTALCTRTALPNDEGLLPKGDGTWI